MRAAVSAGPQVVLAPADHAIDAVGTRQQELERALIDADMAKLEQMLTLAFVRTPPGGRDTDRATYSAIFVPAC